MEKNFPELTTIGALFRFAGILELAAIETLKAATDCAGDDSKPQLERLLTKRMRRSQELERARKEKLNETVLEPLMDMPAEPYIPNLPEKLRDLTPPKLIELAVHIEQLTILFYGDAIDKAGPVLAENKRMFARFQKESAKNEKSLSGLLS